MSGFSPEWLALREGADAAARSPRLTALIGAALPHNPVRALDLGTGTGANVRYLASHLPLRQDWLLVDDDPRLVAEATRATGIGLVRRVNLVAEVASADLGIFAGRALVSASALLDLVSESWLRALAAKCHRVGAAVLFTLTYDGGIRCAPEEPEDHEIREFVNRHQRSDKGFGPALGPTAADVAERCFAELGYHVEREPSPWQLLPETGGNGVAGDRRIAELQKQLIDGWAEAASAIAPERATSIAGWRTRRLAYVAANRSSLTVGHVDLAAWLPRDQT